MHSFLSSATVYTQNRIKPVDDIRGTLVRLVSRLQRGFGIFEVAKQKRNKPTKLSHWFLSKALNFP